MNASTSRAGLLLRAALVLILVLAGLGVGVRNVSAVHDDGVFEIDGNVTPFDGTTGTPGEDWQSLFTFPGPTDTAGSAAVRRTYVTDPTDTTVFVGGTADGDGVANWTYDASMSAPAKDDLLAAFAAIYNTGGQERLYVGGDRFANNGDAQIGLWLFQSQVSPGPVNAQGKGGFLGSNTVGDVLVLSNFTNGGGVANIAVFKVTAVNPDGTLVFGTVVPSTTLPGNVVCNALVVGVQIPADSVCAATNDGDTPSLDPLYTPKFGTTGTYPEESLFEVGLNMGDLGLSGLCFTTFLLETRSSQSITAELKDFVTGSLPTCSIEVAKDGDTLSKVGDDANYTITINNTGVETLFKDDITDDVLGAIAINGADQNPTSNGAIITSTTCGPSLVGGASCTINLSFTVPGGSADPLVNTVTVDYNSKSDFTGSSVTGSDDHSVNLFQPSVTITKTGDALSKVGDAVDYTIVVTNTSSADTPNLTCTISDTLLTVPTPTVTLAPGATATRNISRTTQAGDPDPLVNTASVSCTVGGGFGNTVSASASHSVNLFQPSVAVIKACDDYTKVEPEGLDRPAQAEFVNCTITVNNTSSGDSPALVNGTIVDNLLGDLLDPANTAVTGSNCTATLPTGGSCTITTTRATLATDPSPLVNTVTVHYNPDGFPNDITNSASESVIVLHPNFTLTKSCFNGPVPAGASAIFRAVVTNTGDVALTFIASEAMTAVGGGVFPDGTVFAAGASFTLGIGQSQTFEISIVFPAGATEVTNVLTVTATLPANTGLTNQLPKTVRATCEVQAGGATRTPGFWQTHFDYTTHVFDSPNHLNGGPIDLGWVVLTDPGDVFGLFWANTARNSDGSRRSSLCQARMIASFQAVAAILNSALDNGAPLPVTLAQIAAILGGNDITAIRNLGTQLGAYNNSGDTVAIIDTDGTLAGRADPKAAKAIADIAAVDCL